MYSYSVVLVGTPAHFKRCFLSGNPQFVGLLCKYLITVLGHKVKQSLLNLSPPLPLIHSRTKASPRLIFPSLTEGLLRVLHTTISNRVVIYLSEIQYFCIRPALRFIFVCMSISSPCIIFQIKIKLTNNSPANAIQTPLCLLSLMWFILITLAWAVKQKSISIF